MCAGCYREPFKGSLLTDDSLMVQTERIIFWCSGEPFLLWLYSNYGSFPEPDGIVYCTKKFPVIAAEKAERGIRGEELAGILWQKSNLFG